jgi:predicted phosphodiesterase
MNESPLEALLKIGTDGAAIEKVRGKKHAHPEGWQPSLEFDGSEGVATLPAQPGLPEVASQFDQFLVEQGFDPAEYEVVGSPRTSRWQRYDGDWLTSYRFNFRRKTVEADNRDLEALIAAVKKAKIKPVVETESDRTFWLHVTDLQAGQADGDGAEGMVRRAQELAGIVRARVAGLKKAGTPAGQIFIPITGDLVEGINGWYEMQTFSVQLDRRQQVKLVRRVLTELLMDVAKIGLPVHVAVVPGNHGENRNNGKAYTTLGDNDDVAVVEQIAEAFKLAGVDSVYFSFPGSERLSLTVEVQGWIVGLTHGHIARATGTPEAKILSWFKNMAASRDPIGDADILFTGHYHSGKYSQLIGDTEWIQGGALCDASAWFSQTAGLVNDPLVMMGTITRAQRLESITPYRWPRSRVAAEVI